MRDRMKEIKAKGFDMFAETNNTTTQETIYKELGSDKIKLNLNDFNAIKVGPKTVQDATIVLGDLKKANKNFASKDFVLRAINDGDIKAMREISNFYYSVSGIYSRLIRYMAYMYRYDWYVTPFIIDGSSQKDKALDSFCKVLRYLDNFGVKKSLGEAARKVLLNGAYYAYKIETSDNTILQELPVNYCRHRLNSGKKPVVEFNMKFFDEYYRNNEQRDKVLKLFPQEFRKGYIKYRKGELPPQFQGDTTGWFALDPEYTVYFSMTDNDTPLFMAVIPLLIDLDEAQDLDRRRTQQKLIKLIIQKMPMDKNGELIFDMDEMRALHNNAVGMVKRIMGTDILTTFAEVEVADMSGNASTAQADDLERVERQVYNEAGVSLNLFNTDGNLALEKSVLNDEATMYTLLLSFEEFLNGLIKSFNNKKKIQFQVQLLTTTIYNFKEMAKLYKEHTQIGFGKLLPQIALGQSQSSILATMYFENDVLGLVEKMIPPLQSSVMNADTLAAGKSGGNGEKTGRPEKAEDQKSEKTIQNQESQS